MAETRADLILRQARKAATPADLRWIGPAIIEEANRCTSHEEMDKLEEAARLAKLVMKPYKDRNVLKFRLRRKEGQDG